MRGFAVAIPTLAIRYFMNVFSVYPGHNRIGNNLCMTPDTVGLYYFFSFVLYKNYLGFPAEGENCGMPQAVLCFEIVFVQKVVVGHMAIVAICNLAMGTMRPCGILGSHDMAVNTGGRLIGQIRCGPRDMQNINSNSGYYSQHYNNRELPRIRRFKVIKPGRNMNSHGYRKYSMN
jgi:hypothetical protein